jgi:hypothetical protein
MPFGLGFENGRERVRHGLAGERRPASQHFEQHATEGPDVRSLVDRLPPGLFGAHIGGRSEDGAFDRVARNAEGRLPNDRPHAFRIMGTVDVPRTGIILAANLQRFSGKPWAATTQEALRQGSQRILLEPRGSRRLSSQSLLDLRVSRSIPLGRARHGEVLFDVLNVLNDTAEEGLASDLSASNFGQPSVFIDPRRAMIGIRLNLGRP